MIHSDNQIVDYIRVSNLSFRFISSCNPLNLNLNFENWFFTSQNSALTNEYRLNRKLLYTISFELLLNCSVPIFYSKFQWIFFVEIILYFRLQIWLKLLFVHVQPPRYKNKKTNTNRYLKTENNNSLYLTQELIFHYTNNKL